MRLLTWLQNQLDRFLLPLLYKRSPELQDARKVTLGPDDTVVLRTVGRSIDTTEAHYIQVRAAAALGITPDRVVVLDGYDLDILKPPEE